MGAISRENYVLVQEEAALNGWLVRAQTAGFVAVNIETAGEGDPRAEIVGLALALGPGDACYTSRASQHEQETSSL